MRRFGCSEGGAWRGLHTIGSYYIWLIFALSYFSLVAESAGAVPFAAMLAMLLLLQVTRRRRESSWSG